MDKKRQREIRKATTKSARSISPRFYVAIKIGTKRFELASRSYKTKISAEQAAKLMCEAVPKARTMIVQRVS